MSSLLSNDDVTIVTGEIELTHMGKTAEILIWCARKWVSLIWFAFLLPFDCLNLFVFQSIFLVHQIKISAGFAHMRKFYLTYSVPTHGKGKKQTVARSDVIVMLK